MEPTLQTILNIWDVPDATPLTEEDAREIRDNVTGFFTVLSDWREADARVGLLKA